MCEVNIGNDCSHAKQDKEFGIYLVTESFDGRCFKKKENHLTGRKNQKLW